MLQGAKVNLSVTGRNRLQALRQHFFCLVHGQGGWRKRHVSF
jgi:hypothetical protein